MDNPVKPYSLILLMFLLLPVAHAGVSEVKVSPESPRQGDVVSLFIQAQPEESVSVTISFTEDVPVIDGKYDRMFDDVRIPSTPNSFSVRAEGVENLHVSVKLLIWITKSATAENEVATVSQSNVPRGRYDIRVHGDPGEGVSLVKMRVTASTTVTTNEDGLYVYSYDTSSIPLGTFTVRVGGVTRTVTLSDRTPSPVITDPHPTGLVNTSTPTISANFSDGSLVDTGSVRMRLNGIDVTASAVVTSKSVTYRPMRLRNGTVNRVEVRVADTYGSETLLEWGFTVMVPPAPRPPLGFDVTGVSVFPAVASVGEEVIIGVEVSNTGSQPGNHTVEVFLDDSFVDEWTVFLGEGASDTLYLNAAGGGPGLHTVHVGDASAVFLMLSGLGEEDYPTFASAVRELPFETGVAIVEQLPPGQALEVLGEVGVEAASMILEAMNPNSAAGILEAAVRLDNADFASSALQEMDERICADLLLWVDPETGARLLELMTAMDVQGCARRVVHAAVNDVEATGMVLGLMEPDPIAEVLIEVAGLLSKPSVVAAILEAMDLDSVSEVVTGWISEGALRELGIVFGHLSAPGLNSVYGSLAPAERFLLLPYLPSRTVSLIAPELFDLSDLTVSDVDVSMMGEMRYGVRVEVRNSGEAESGPFRVLLYVDASAINGLRVESLPAGESRTLDFEWSPVQHGTYTVRAELDEADEVLEADEGNNVYDVVFKVARTQAWYQQYQYVLILVLLGGLMALVLIWRKTRS